MRFRTNVSRNATSIYILLPKEVVEYLDLEVGAGNVIIEDKSGKHGRYQVGSSIGTAILGIDFPCAKSLIFHACNKRNTDKSQRKS